MQGGAMKTILLAIYIIFASLAIGALYTVIGVFGGLV
jgi:hypothetical protein